MRVILLSLLSASALTACVADAPALTFEQYARCRGVAWNSTKSVEAPELGLSHDSVTPEMFARRERLEAALGAWRANGGHATADTDAVFDREFEAATALPVAEQRRLLNDCERWAGLG